MNGYRTLAIMDSPKGDEFLAGLVVSLSLASRDLDLNAKSRSGLNEVLLVVATQPASPLGQGLPAYPGVVLLENLKEKAQIAGCVTEVMWALRDALRRVDGQDGA